MTETTKIPRRQRNAVRWAKHRAKMDKKDATRFGSYLYRPHPGHFKKPAKSPGARENARGERIWAKFEAVRREWIKRGVLMDDSQARFILSGFAGMAVKL